MKVGEEVRSICGKCGDVWHVVIALVDGRAAKVECGDCHARHRYRIPGGAASTRTGTRRTATGTRKKVAAAADIVEADLSKPVRPFRTTETFGVGERVAHPTFGEGVVQAVTGPTKIEVLFGAERKLLGHNR
jgi:hypothetical protein